MANQKTKYIYLLLTRSGLPISTMMQKLHLGSYTHCCIGFDEHLKRLYSFGTLFTLDPFHTGLKKENIYQGFYTGKPYMPTKILRIPVTPKEYCNICKALHVVKAQHDRFKFNTLGMFYHLFKIDKERPGYFFCSEFIYTVFHRAGLVDFHKPRHFVLPDDFLKLKLYDVVFDGQLIALQALHAPFHGAQAEPFLFENRFADTDIAT